MAGWRPALRLARRDALRNKGRSILVLVMIALPVLAVSAADVVYLTNDVDSVESLDRRLGSADARITAPQDAGQVVQDFDDDAVASWGGGSADGVTLETVRETLGRDVPASELREGGVRIETERGVLDAEATELDVSSPLVDGLFKMSSGRWPESGGEAVVNAALADKGFAVGSELVLDDGPSLIVVGIAESTTSRNYPRVVSGLDDLGLETQGNHRWLIGGGPVSWDEVRALNRVGALVLSRAVIENPPPDSERPAEIRQWESGVDEAWIAVVVLVVVMALLEVVLLAGPAFAVGARRQARTLALMAASGGTPKQARRVILAGGLVLGGVAALLGVVLGVAGRLGPAACRPALLRLLARPLRGKPAPPEHGGGVRAAERLPGSRRAGMDRLAAGRGGGAGRAARRPQAQPAFATAGSGARAGRDRRLDRRGHAARRRQRADRRRPPSCGARHDPARAGGGGDAGHGWVGAYRW